MRDERVIRSHIADLQRHAAAPCPHRHACPLDEAQCEAGRLLMAAAARALSWALGGEPDYDRVVEEAAAGRDRR